MRTRERNGGWLYWLLAAAGAALILWVLFTGVSNLESGHTDEGRQQLEDTIRRATVTCYATEGVYPPTIEYLEEHYGVQIDTDHYTVFYDTFAENLMPDITVLATGD